MKIRILSDLHLEFGFLNLPVMEGEDTQVLVLAGDIGLAAKSWTYIPFIEEVSERFQDVIYIMGNHEYYGTSILRGLDKIKERIQFEIGATNVHVVDNQTVHIGDVSFVCATLWADYNNLDHLCMYHAELWMTDHKKIRNGPSVRDAYKSKFRAADAAELHRRSRGFIFPNVRAEHENGQKVVVVTHHAPSVLSIAEEYKTGQYAILNGAYASKLEEDIFDTHPELMIHGHTHRSFDYELVDEISPDGGETRIICNPRGYKDVEENPEFNPTLVVEV